MSKVIENHENCMLALCNGQLLVMPKARKTLLPYLEDHPDLVDDDPRYTIHADTESKTVKAYAEGAPDARKAEIGQDEAELAAETVNANEDAKDADKDKKPESYSVVPPAAPGPSDDVNAAYNAGKGISVVPPPKEVTDVRGGAPAPAVEEPKAEEPKAPKKGSKKGSKEKK